MNCNVSIVIEEQIIHTQVNQMTISHSCIYQLLNEVVLYGIRNRINRYLFDIKGTRNPDDIEANTLLDFSKIYNLGFYWQSRTAVILDSPIDAWHQEIEANLRRAGFDFRMFTEKTIALDWLRSPLNKQALPLQEREKAY